MGNIELGNSLFILPSKNIITISKSSVLKQSLLSYFRSHYDDVSSFPLDESQVDAWQNCIEVLGEAFSRLPEAYGKISLVFEYVLPKHNPASKKFINENHIVADVIGISADTVLVMEFKRRADEFEGLFKQAGMYKRRLEKYHVESWDKDVEAILVLTSAEDYFSAEYYFDGMEGVVSCSPDRLAETLLAVFGKEMKPHPAIWKWLHSDFQIREAEERDYSANENKNSRILRIALLEGAELEKAINSISTKMDEIEKSCAEGRIDENERNAQLGELRALMKNVGLRNNNLREKMIELSKKISSKESTGLTTSIQQM